MRRTLFASAGAAVALIIATGSAMAQSERDILVFGGRDHDEFLGCINCSEYDAKSLWNEYSSYGLNNKYGKWNRYGQHASAYSSTSACSEYASSPPILVDRAGNSYGYLSLSKFKHGSICAVGGNEQLCMALRVACSDD